MTKKQIAMDKINGMREVIAQYLAAAPLSEDEQKRLAEKYAKLEGYILMAISLGVLKPKDNPWSLMSV